MDFKLHKWNYILCRFACRRGTLDYLPTPLSTIVPYGFIKLRAGLAAAQNSIISNGCGSFLFYFLLHLFFLFRCVENINLVLISIVDL